MSDLAARMMQAVEALTAERDALKAELEQWRKLSDPATLHANLVRGIPCKLPDNLLLHLLGDEWQSIAEMREALFQARETFARYAESHGAKGTPDGDAKAAENHRLAEVMRKALEGVE
jgi:hypothetical protein